MSLPECLGIHHLKFPVADLDRSLDFYERALGARRLTALDHRTPNGEVFACLLEAPGLGTLLELRLAPDHAERQAGFDPITLAVRGRADLEAWSAHWTQADVPHSPVLVGLVGWLMIAEDPDRRRIRLYTLESHGPECAPSRDPYWL